jgi:nucleotide-binding universal stress UspA family protein
MFNRIVVPLDGSETAEVALPYARALARGLKVSVELLCVIDLAEVVRTQSIVEDISPNSVAQTDDRKRAGYLSVVSRTFADVPVEYNIENGDAASVIIQSAAAHDGSLICMASHGRSGVSRCFLGRVAEKVLHGVRAPILIIRATEGALITGEKRLAGVIATLDGSAVAEQVLPLVAALARDLDLDVNLFRAYEIPYGTDAAGRSSGINLETPNAQIRRRSCAYLEQQCDALRKAGLQKLSYTASEGYCAYEIVRHARNYPNKLIAMCTHGRSGVKRWMLGSVAETVARHSGAPMLIVRAAA